MAELLSMQEGNVPGYQDRTPLFPGGTCFPLSGETSSLADDRLDQLSVIFGIIGTPSKEDIGAIGNANEYIKTLGTKQPKKLEELYPAADPAALDLLWQMLQFNPKARCTAEEALEHDFFQGVRRKEMEKVAEKALVMPDFLESLDIDLESLKRRTYEEVIWYRDNQNRKPSGSKQASDTKATK
jgi:mitogen-activated protein kinase 1/3